MSDRRYGADAHNTDYERGREDERAAIVAWLRKERERLEAEANKRGGYMLDDHGLGQAYFADLAADGIESGTHLVGDDE